LQLSWQLPLVQVPLGQLLLQLPQFCGSLSVSVQPLLQHAGVVPEVQALPQPPQLFTSLVVSSTQEPVVPSELAQQAGLTPEQVLSQLPQLLGSWLTSTQLPSQDVCGAAPQLPLPPSPPPEHWPPEQVPPLQLLAQLPQLSGSLSMSVQDAEQHPGVVSPCWVQSTPLPAAVQPPQLLTSLSPSEQLLLQHWGVTPSQLLSQLPQLFGSLVMSTQVPSQEDSEPPPLPPLPPPLPLLPPSQAAAPPHWPMAQVMPLQLLPQVPQLFGSLSVSTQLPLQQPGVVPASQALLQVPQFETSFDMSVQPVAPQQPGVVKPSWLQSSPQKPQFALSLFGSEQVEEQHWPASQTLPHLPQLFWSSEVSSQLPLQQAATVSPCWVQSVPVPSLQPPQLLMSVLVSVQTPSQLVLAPPSPEPPVQPASAALHLPLEQIWPLVQAVAHLPQLRLSVIVLVQLLLQLVWPEGQPPASLPPLLLPASFPPLPLLVQAPLVQVEPEAQAFAHLPQFFESVEVLAQVPEQLTSPPEQVVAQAPELQAWVPVHAWPQLPQLVVLDWVLTQVPLVAGHSVCGLVQVTPHVPLLQAWPLGQAWAQLPQSWLLVWRFTQAFEQAVRPPVQLVPQVPFEQVWPLAQALPQAPQFVLLVLVSTQALLQSVWLLAQLLVQVPLEQPWPLVQAWPQLPQSALVVWRLTHCPEQLVRPPEQLAVWQAPLMQATPLLHDLPQPPQSALFEVVSTHWPLQICCPLAQVVEQVPLVQAEPVAQALPQLPQFLLSVWVLVQAVPQRVSLPQLRVQTLFSQLSPAGQALPQAPQSELFEPRSTQAELQSVEPPGQLVWQAPFKHASPLGQASPHLPQFLASVAVVVQMVPHST
jgi:hypothetical protein